MSCPSCKKGSKRAYRLADLHCERWLRTLNDAFAQTPNGVRFAIVVEDRVSEKLLTMQNVGTEDESASFLAAFLHWTSHHPNEFSSTIDPRSDKSSN